MVKGYTKFLWCVNIFRIFFLFIIYELRACKIISIYTRKINYARKL